MYKYEVYTAIDVIDEHDNVVESCDVVWLCKVCHNQIHVEMKGGEVLFA